MLVFPGPFLSFSTDMSVAGMDPHTASLTMTMLQNPIKFAFGKINDDLKAASSSHKKVGRSLDKVCTRLVRPDRPGSEP
jgi:hypothetical protein